MDVINFPLHHPFFKTARPSEAFMGLEDEINPLTVEAFACPSGCRLFRLPVEPKIDKFPDA
jgi:hypothetical protein